MSARTRVVAIVAVAAALAVAVVVGATLLQSRGSTAQPQAEEPTGDPPLLLDLGLRDDPEARALRRAEELYGKGRKEQAARIFLRYPSVNGRVGLAFARWPTGTVVRLEQLAREHPKSGVVQLNLGFALFWTGRREDALAAWRATRRVDPDSLAAVRATDLLFPQFARGVPVFVPGDRSRGRVRKLLLEGVAFQRVGKQVSARARYDAAARLDQTNVEVLVASAVVRFDKANPSAAFARLGPLARRFPRAPTVRFHLGLLLLWIGRVEEAKRQLGLARAADPDDPVAREADRFLRRLEDIQSRSKS